jgi:hypothetical protein
MVSTDKLEAGWRALASMQHSQARQEIGRLLKVEIARREERQRSKGKVPPLEHEKEDRERIRRNLGLIALRIRPDSGTAGKKVICSSLPNVAEKRGSYIQLPAEFDSRPAGANWNTWRILIETAGSIVADQASAAGIEFDKYQIYCDALRGTSMREYIENKYVEDNKLSTAREFSKLRTDLTDALIVDSRVMEMWQYLDAYPVHMQGHRDINGPDIFDIVPGWLKNVSTTYDNLYHSDAGGDKLRRDNLVSPSIDIGSKVLVFDHRAFVLPKAVGERLISEEDLSHEFLSELKCLGWDPDLEWEWQEGVTPRGLPEVEYSLKQDYGWIRMRYYIIIPVIIQASRNLIDEPIVHFVFVRNQCALHVLPLMPGTRLAGMHPSDPTAHLDVMPAVAELALAPRHRGSLILRDNREPRRIEALSFREDNYGQSRVAISGLKIQYSWPDASNRWVPNELCEVGELGWDEGYWAGAVHGYQDSFIPRFEIRRDLPVSRPQSIAELILANRPLEAGGLGNGLVEHVRRVADYWIGLVQKDRLAKRDHPHRR